MTDAQIVEPRKAVLIIGEFQIFIVKNDTFLHITTVEVIDRHSISPQRHPNLILHPFREPKIPPIKLKRRRVVTLLFIHHTYDDY